MVLLGVGDIAGDAGADHFGEPVLVRLAERGFTMRPRLLVARQGLVGAGQRRADAWSSGGSER